jgi:excisionase family DNA binding protein
MRARRKDTTVGVLEHEPITADENEQSALSLIEGVLKNVNSPPKLIGPLGEEIELPRSVFHVLRLVVYHMQHGKAISIVPLAKELTTQEAADLLNVSRPFLVKLLEQGNIPFIKVGTHRRVLFNDLMEYKKQRDTKRRQGLAELTQLSQELGLYDE